MKPAFTKIIVTTTFIFMVIVNSLANTLPLNGVTSGEVSDSYPNLFAPAGITFSIWGLIYFLLAIYTAYQFTVKTKLVEEANPYFIASSIANGLWIYSWHYRYIGVSVILIVIILFSLIKISDLIKKEKLCLKEKLFIHLPFSVYFGWITVAAIANVTTFLVSINWNRFGVSEAVWTVLALIIGCGIGITRSLKDKNTPYLLVFIWAYLGILIKHTSEAGFANKYPAVILTALFCFIVFLITEVRLILRSKTLPGRG